VSAATPALLAMLHLRVVATALADYRRPANMPSDEEALVAFKTALVNIRASGQSLGPTPQEITDIGRASRQLVPLEARIRAQATSLRADSSLTPAERVVRLRMSVADATTEVLRTGLASSDPAVTTTLPVLGRVADLVAKQDYSGALLALSQGLRAVFPEWAGIWTPDLEARIQAVAELATAKDAATVVSTLEQLAARPGSWHRKRFDGGGQWYFAVNSYLGVIGGQETIIGGPRSLFYGPFLPIGIETGWRMSRNFSVGLFGYLVDLGAVAAYRLRADTTKADTTASNLSALNLRNVLAPGAALILGIGRFPLALGATYGYSPRLRDLSKGAAAPVRRFAFFVAYDLPLF